MTITLDSVVFDGKIRGLASNDVYVFVAVRRTIYVMKYHTCVRKIEMDHPGDSKISVLMVLYPALLAAVDNYLFLGACDGGVMESVALKWNIVAIMHPPTYLNKVIVLCTREICVFNIVTRKFVSRTQLNTDGVYTYIVASPALDTVAVVVQDEGVSRVTLLNLKSMLAL
jgi:U3 small nucleolar RNA-associated protein 21